MSQVQDPEMADGVDDELTPAEDGGVAEPTSTQELSDAEELRERLERQEELLRQSESDFNKMKSSLQKRENELTREFEARERAMREELEKLALSSMTEEQRTAYSEQREQQRIREMEKQLQNANASVAQIREMNDALTFFIAEGIPPDALNVTEDYDALVTSGWQWISDELDRLYQIENAYANNAPQQQQPRKKEAPEVVTDSNAPARKGYTWADLITKYGSMEEVYRLVESELLSPDVIPLE